MGDVAYGDEDRVRLARGLTEVEAHRALDFIKAGDLDAAVAVVDRAEQRRQRILGERINLTSEGATE